MYKTDYLGMHESRYKKLIEDGETGWSSENEINQMVEYIERAFEFTGIETGKKILDIGCGDGSLTIRLARMGFDVCGVDISPTAINWAVKKAAQDKCLIHYTIGDALDLPYEDEIFDIAIDSHCLHCIIDNDRKTFLENVHRVLKKDGLFVVMTMTGDPADDDIRKNLDPISRNLVINGIAGRHLGLPVNIMEEIKSAGFRITTFELADCKEDNQMDLMVSAIKT